MGEGQVILSGITTAAFIEAIKEVVKFEIQSAEPEVLMSREEAAAYLKVNLSTLSKWTTQQRFPCYGIGGRRYYKKSEINASMEVLQF